VLETQGSEPEIVPWMQEWTEECEVVDDEACILLRRSWGGEVPEVMVCLMASQSVMLN
jgi:hypothetical protein